MSWSGIIRALASFDERARLDQRVLSAWEDATQCAMRCNAMQQDSHSLTQSLPIFVVSHSIISQSTTPYPGGGRKELVWQKPPDELQSPGLSRNSVPESRETRQMDIAPPRPSRLPRTGLARSDPWLPSGLLRCPCLPPPLPAANRAPASGSSRGETDLVCGMCIPIRYCTLAALLCCTLG